MICVLALILCGVIGIFSATHREIAKEAFDCVFRRITLRPCESGLDTRLKAKITGTVLRHSPTAGKIMYRYFEVFSWALLILTFVSLGGLAVSGYNYAIYGNCNGEYQEKFCIFDPLGSHSGYSNIPGGACGTEEGGHEKLTLDGVNLPSFSILKPGRSNVVFFIGCYGCGYTKEAYPTIHKLLERKDVTFIFAHLPVNENMHYYSHLENCVYKNYQSQYKIFMELMFSLSVEELQNPEIVLQKLGKLGFSQTLLETCTIDEEIVARTDRQQKELEETGVYGTPTVFVNGDAVVGPKPYRVYWWKLH